MSNPEKMGSKLDPALRERLLKESKSPLRGLRRGIWIALFGSATIGLFIMTARSASGESVSLSDASIQIGAFLLFSFLLWLDRPRR